MGVQRGWSKYLRAWSHFCGCRIWYRLRLDRSSSWATAPFITSLPPRCITFQSLKKKQPQLAAAKGLGSDQSSGRICQEDQCVASLLAYQVNYTNQRAAQQVYTYLGSLGRQPVYVSHPMGYEAFWLQDRSMVRAAGSAGPCWASTGWGSRYVPVLGHMVGELIAYSRDAVEV